MARVFGEVTSIFEKVGLAVHVSEMSGGEMKALGVELDSRLPATSLTREPRSSQLSLNEEKGERRDVGGVGRTLYVRCAGQETRIERVPLCILVHSGRAWETGGSLAIRRCKCFEA